MRYEQRKSIRLIYQQVMIIGSSRRWNHTTCVWLQRHLIATFLHKEWVMFIEIQSDQLSLFTTTCACIFHIFQR